MKLKSILISAFLLVSACCLAQEPDATRFSVKVGAGFPGSGVENFTNGLFPVKVGLEGIYSDYCSELQTTPAFVAECMYAVNEWFSAGAKAVYTGYSNQIISGTSNQVISVRNGKTMALLPSGQVSYYKKNAFKLYMSVSMGIGYYDGFDNLDRKLSFEVMFAPIGFEYGRSLFCFAEAGLGTALNWGNAGIGFRF